MADTSYVDSYRAITERAQQAAYASYYNSKGKNESEQVALDRAKFAWQQELDRANQTGMWNGQYNMPTDQWFASSFGTWMPNGPQEGQQTLQANQQYYNQAYQNALAYGQYYAPGTAPTQGQQTLEAQNQAQQQQNWMAQTYGGYYPTGQAPTAGQQTLAQQNQQFTQGFNTWQEQARQEQARQQTTQSYLQLLSQLRGPADYAKYQQVLGATPGGMRDLVGAAMGQYIPGGGATTGVAPQAANLNTLYGDVMGGGQGATSPDYNAALGNQMGGAGAAAGSQNNPFGQLPAPNQVAAQSWKNLAPSQQQLLLGGWEAGGWNKDDVTALMSQALPKYAQNSPTAGTWRLNPS